MTTEKMEQKKWKLDEVNHRWELIADNGGGITLQVGTDYQHWYLGSKDDMDRLADDLISLEINGLDSVADWDGNDLCSCGGDDYDDNSICTNCDKTNSMLDPSDEDIKNGGYHIIPSIGDLLATDDYDIWGGALVDLKNALLKKLESNS